MMVKLVAIAAGTVFTIWQARLTLEWLAYSPNGLIATDPGSFAAWLMLGNAVVQGLLSIFCVWRTFLKDWD